MNCAKCGQRIQRLNGEPLPCCACSGLPVLACIVRQSAERIGQALLSRRTWQKYGRRHHYWTPPEYDGEPLFDMRA